MPKNDTRAYTTFYITEALEADLKEITERTGVPRAKIYDRAFRDIIGKAAPQVSEKVKNRKKTDPEYIARSVFKGCYVDRELHAKMKELAAQNDCNLACLIYQALIDWMARYKAIVSGLI